MELDELVSQALDDACTSLVPAPGSSVCAATPRDAELRLASIIGFSGDRLRGTLGIAASAAGIRRIAAHFGIDDRNERGVADSMGELSNLVLGHVKRSFSRRDVLITISTPLVVRGVAIEICGREDGNWYERSVSCDDDQVRVWLDLSVDEGFAVGEEQCSDGMVSEGETLLF